MTLPQVPNKWGHRLCVEGTTFCVDKSFHSDISEWTSKYIPSCVSSKQEAFLSSPTLIQSEWLGRWPMRDRQRLCKTANRLPAWSHFPTTAESMHSRQGWSLWVWPLPTGQLGLPGTVCWQALSNGTAEAKWELVFGLPVSMATGKSVQRTFSNWWKNLSPALKSHSSLSSQ